MILTKEEFDSLYNSDITIQQYDDIISKINHRFDEICEKFLLKRNKHSWFDYDVVDLEHIDSGGCFEPNLYRETINITGDYIDPPEGYKLAIPTRWLWTENWQEEMQQTIQNHRQHVQEQKNREEEQQRQKKIMMENIVSKLTAEELKIIRFK